MTTTPDTDFATIAHRAVARAFRLCAAAAPRCEDCGRLGPTKLTTSKRYGTLCAGCRANVRDAVRFLRGEE